MRHVAIVAFCFWSGLLGATLANGAQLAGTMAGQFEVTRLGTASYEIPIKVPPGTAGLEPHVALNYNSAGGNGLLGVGWKISGLSQIARCPATYAQDGYFDGVDFDANDKLCLNGKRLVAFSGDYGEAGTEYRTEIETFAKIVGYGGINGTNSWFKVWTKSGEIYEYGRNNNSSFEVPPPTAGGHRYVNVWAVNRIADTAGNYLDVIYRHDATTNENYPVRINYTGNTRAGMQPYNSVRFNYQNRPDVQTTYVGGGSDKISLTKRLASITTYAGSTRARTYQITYDLNGGSGRSRIHAIQVCGASNDCFQPTRFTWSESFSSSGVPGNKFDYAHNVQYIAADNEGRIHMGDWNGDGVTDIMWYDPDTGDTKWYLNKGGANQVDAYADDPIDPERINDDRGSLHFGDWNGDGITDVMWYDSDEGDNRWYVNNGDGTFSGEYHPILKERINGGNGWLKFGDWNGDGTTDVMWYAPEDGKNRWFLGGYVSTSTSSGLIYKETSDPLRRNDVEDSPDEGRLYLGNWNNDGLTDVMFYDKENGDTRWYINKGSRKRFDPVAFDQIQYNPIPTTSIDNSSGNLKFGDWNADGITDVMWYNPDNGKNRWYINDGYARMRALPQPISASLIENGQLHFGDWNGDGITDVALYRSSNGRNRWYLNDGNLNLTPVAYDPVSPGEINNGTGRWYFGDWDGNGIIDFLWFYPTKGRIHWYTNAKAKKEHITEITDGLSSQIRINYAPLTDDAVYTKYVQGSDAYNVTYPYRTVQSAAYVVRRFSATNSAGGQSATAFKYRGLIQSMHGRGLGGFRGIKRTDEQSGITVDTGYRTIFPLTGRWVSRVTYQGNGTKSKNNDTYLKRVSRSFVTKTLSGPSISRYSVYLWATDTYTYPLGTIDMNESTLLIRTGERRTYDDYGNATRIYIWRNPGSGFGYRTTTVNTYVNDVANWQLGRLTQSTVTKKTPLGLTATRSSSFSYDPQTGFLTRETVQPGTALAQTTTYQHDVYGNRTRVTTTTAQDSTGRSISTEYRAKGRFPFHVTNALGHTETHVYSSVHGGRLSLTGPNGLQTTWLYDTLGRVVAKHRADGTSTTTQYRKCGTLCPTNNGVFSILTTDSTGAQQLKVTDAAENVVSTSTRGQGGQWIDQLTQYDVQNRPIKKSVSHYRGDVPLWTTLTYDVLGRVTRASTPASDSGSGRAITQFGYDGLTTTEIDANGHSRTQTVNALGQTIQVTDALGSATSYLYGPFGDVIAVTDAAGNVITMTYDARGRKVAMDDPDMGQWTYSYNGYGELISQTDAKNQTTTMVYDKLGRMIERHAPEGTATWSYDSEWIGALDEVTGPNGFTRQLTYDNLGRVTRNRAIIDGESFNIQTTYDNQSRVRQLTYPHGLRIRRHYGNYGYLVQVSNPDTNVIYWQANARDASGHVINATLGNGLTTVRDYDQARGYINSILTGSTLGTEIQSLSYTWDKVGNLRSRTDQNQAGLVETFSYDALNRLIASEVVGTSTSMTVAYDAIGNITRKSDVGNYRYGRRPHAVTRVTGQLGRTATYIYDANGNMIRGRKRAVQWTSFNKPRAIVREASPPIGELYDGGALTYANASAFFYAPDGHRYKQLRNQAGTAGANRKTIVYVGGIYERRSSSLGRVEHRAYISAGGRVVAIDIRRSKGSDTTQYLHRDHIGSVTAITDANGNLVERLAYDAFGKRRKVIGWRPDRDDSLLFKQAHVIARGYTGHEHLDNVGLIHMNGRVYDPIIGRFISPDPLVPSPESTQGLNRYTYVNNNPLSYTDPSGHIALSTVAYIASAVLITAGEVFDEPLLTQVGFAILGAAIGPEAWYQASAIGFGAGFTASGGDLEAGFYSAIAATAFYGVGSAYSADGVAAGVFDTAGTRYVAKVVTHGVVGGAFSDLRGGSFSDGFVGAGAAQAFAPSFKSDFATNVGVAGRVVIAATIGGTASELSGGKFANGAVTAAFSHTFNWELHWRQERAIAQEYMGDELALWKKSIKTTAHDISHVSKDEVIIAVSFVATASDVTLLFFPESAPVTVPLGVAFDFASAILKDSPVPLIPGAAGGFAQLGLKAARVPLRLQHRGSAATELLTEQALQ